VRSNGTGLIFAGFIGGTGGEGGYDLALDGAGYLYLVGPVNSTEATFPIEDAADPSWNGGNDAFVAKVHPSGSDIIYATYIGGSAEDYGNVIAVDEAGNAYVGGSTFSGNGTFPVSGGIDSSYNGGTNDGFMTKIGHSSTADVRISGVASTSAVRVDQPLSYTFRITNNALSASDAAGIIFTDTLPVGTGLISVSASQGGCGGSTAVITCTLGTLPPGDSADVTLVITAPVTSGVIANTAVAFSSLVDPTPANNSQIITKTVLPPITVQFSAASHNVTESIGSVPIGVTLSAASGITATVSYSTSNGSALAGNDYTAASGMLTFPPGVTVRTLNVPIINDGANESNEAFSVQLSSPVNVVLGTPSLATITIVGSPVPGVQLSAPSYSVSESAGPAVVTATLDAASGITATVNYSTANISAVAGIDYTAANGTLTFPPGATVRVFSIPIAADTAIEMDESFIVALSGPSNAVLGTQTAAALTIIDDDVSQRIFLPVVVRSFGGNFEIEPNNPLALANGPIAPGLDYHGYQNDANDYFSFYSAGGSISATLTDTSAPGTQLYLYYQDTSHQVGHAGGAPYHIDYNGAAGWYYVRISASPPFNTTTPYTLIVTYP
jgi:uncharacterized repeat protein (TIGR01451 family)